MIFRIQLQSNSLLTLNFGQSSFADFKQYGYIDYVVPVCKLVFQLALVLNLFNL